MEQSRTRGKEQDAKEAEALRTGGAKSDCRCEKVSRMTPRQLLQVMMKDLAFWKKPEK